MAATLRNFIPYSHDEKASNPPICHVLKFTTVLMVLRLPGMPESFGTVHSNCSYAKDWGTVLY